MNDKEINELLIELDNDLINIFKRSYLNTIENETFGSVIPNIKPENIRENNKAPYSLEKYLYEKIRVQVLNNLLTNIILMENFYNKNIKNIDIKDYVDFLFLLHDKTIDSNESYSDNLMNEAEKKQKELLAKRVNDINSYFKENVKEKKITKKVKNTNISINNESYLVYDSKPLDRSSPYIYFNALIKKKCDYDFFFRDPIFILKINSSLNDKIPSDFTEYALSLINIIYDDIKGNNTSNNEKEKSKKQSAVPKNITKANNLIKRSNTILNHLNSNKRFSSFREIDRLIDKYDENIDDINCMLKKLFNHEKKYFSFYYLMNNYFHNNFFLGINHPMIETIIKRIDIKTLYNATKEDTSSYTNTSTWENVSDMQTIIKSYPIKESIYYLSFLELIMEYDINFNDITEDIFVINSKKDAYLNNDVYNGTRYDYMREQQHVFDSTIRFIYEVLDSAKNDLPEIISYYLNIFENKILNINDKKILEGDLNLLTLEINKSLKSLNHNLTFKKLEKGLDEDFLYNLSREKYYLLTYLIKQSFFSKS